MMGIMSTKGLFKPKNIKKYKGDPTRIIYRSSWEFKFMVYCDQHPDILEWTSEETIVPYKSPIDGEWHRYFPDFVVRKRTKTGQIEVAMIEIKPNHQTLEPKRSKPSKSSERRFITEVREYGINTAKWAAAKEFCRKRNWKFMIITEKRSILL